MAEGPNGSPSERPSKGPDPLLGRVINDRFRVVSLVARGGMGKVYRAEQAPLGREVALKVLNPTYSGESDPEFHKRFFLEASICSKLRHPNTVTIFDYGRTDDDIYYIAMELLEGRTLHRAIREDGPFAPQRAMHVARQICRSLREAHGLGVIHRDLKPANVFLVRHGDESDFVKVLDFGLVKELGQGEDLTQTGLFMGSPKYMAPEQIRGEDVDARVDVYALGVILYEMLTGKVPFDRQSSVHILMAHVHEPPPPFVATNPEVSVPTTLEQIVMKALAKRPEDRFAGMDAMLAALKAGSDPSHSFSRSLELSTEQALHASVPPPAPAPMAILAESAVAPALDAPKRLRASIVLAVLASVVVLGGATLVALLAKSGVGNDAPVAVTPPVPSVDANAAHTAPREAAAPEPVARTMVVLRSAPPGAIVRIGDRAYGPTPADIEWTGDDAARGRQVTFVFKLDGYRDYSVTRVVSGDRLEVMAELERVGPAARAPVRPRRPARAPPEESRPVGPMNGFKMDPY